jgi:methionyl-tRNA formyltransferase
MKILFIGNGIFGVPALKKLHEIYQVTVITTPPRRFGRVVQNTPIYIAGKALGCLVYTANDINELEHRIISTDFDLIVVASYGQIIKMKILDSAKYGAINIHGSLLPKYRGASCIQAAILNRDSETGVTFIKMNAAVDAGSIITQRKMYLPVGMGYIMLLDQLSNLAAENILLTITKYTRGVILRPQIESEATYCCKITKDDCLLDFNKNVDDVYAKMKAYESNHGVFFYLPDNNTEVKIKDACMYTGRVKGDFLDGELICVENNKLFINCNKSSLQIVSLQLPNKKVMSARDFINGHKKLITQFADLQIIVHNV